MKFNSYNISAKLCDNASLQIIKFYYRHHTDTKLKMSFFNKWHPDFTKRWLDEF